jgi:Tfp pilus assembly protein FimT
MRFVSGVVRFLSLVKNLLPLRKLKTQDSRHKTQDAITFIELLIVITIIAVVSTLAIPQFRKAAVNFELESFVKDIYYLCQYLRSSAISQGKIYCLNLNPNEGKIWATYKDETDFKNLQGRFAKPYAVPQTITITSQKTEAYFFPDGSIEEITIDFRNKYERKLTLSIKGAAADIKIE